MRLLFVSEHGKFDVDSKIVKKMQQSIDGFSEQLIWIGKCKFSPLIREYSYFAVTVLSSRPKIPDLIKNSFL